MTDIEIVHLEDSTLDAELIRAWLERAGFAPKIDRATDRDEFLRAVRSRRHDIILADYSLPSFDGLSALEIAREVVPETPFIFVSGMLGEEVAIDTLKSGATDYVLKQRLERLAPAVRRALGESRERSQRRRAEAALREGELRLRLILDSITDYAIVTTDTEGHIQAWSAGAERLFGQPSHDVAGRPISILYTPEDIREGLPEWELLSAREGRHGADERWFVRRDGSRFWGSGGVVPLVDGSGRLLGFTKVVRDITDRKRAEDALREADRRKDEFLAMLAHELRNPLSAIKNAVELARLPDLSTERLERATRIIDHQSRHLARLIDDLLDVSRISRGKINLRPQPLSLTDVIHRAVETTRPLFDERRHRLDVSTGPGPLPLVADPTRIDQIVGNLLTNAAKYTEPGGHVSIAAKREGGKLLVRVRDNGIGMAPEVLRNAFDLFAQADESLDRAKGGLGIGLTVARKLAELHGGTLVGNSDGPGQGSEFVLTLPASDPVDGVGESPKSPTRRGALDNGASGRVLVVDDNVPTAWSLAELLRSEGHDVTVAHDGAEAVDVAQRDAPDIVLLDIGLPTLDGYQVARKIRDRRGPRQPLLIAITGYGGERVAAKAREAGFDHHLVKPVDFNELLVLLTKAGDGG